MLNSRQPEKLPSERSFGLLFTAIFLGESALNYYKHASLTVCAAWLAGGIVLGLLTLVVPSLLAPLNRAWYHLGQWLGKIVSPVVLGIIFFVVLSPVAAITRLFGRDELRLKRNSGPSYWIDRTPPGPAQDSFKHQF
jgi:hypothetical protein